MSSYFEPVHVISMSVVLGDLLVGNASGTLNRLPIGANGSILNVSAGAVRWGNTIDTGGLIITAGNLLVSAGNATALTFITGANASATGLVRLQNANTGIRFRNSTNTGDWQAIEVDGTDTLMIGQGGGLALTITPQVNLTAGGTAMGGGAAPTLGTIGGAGPAAAGQNSWLRINIAGVASFVPVWR